MIVNLRRTSVYSLRVRSARSQETAFDLLWALRFTGTAVQDQHVAVENGESYAAIGFRAAGDDEARRLANELIDYAEVDPASTTLLTGYGVHRRTVEI